MASVSLNPELYGLDGLRFSVVGSRHDFDVLEARLNAFGFFVAQRLVARGPWPAARKQPLTLLLTDRDHTKEELEERGTWDYVNVATPPLTGRESDEELIFKVTEACEGIVRRLLPGVRLGVLADAFITAGCECWMRPPPVSARGVKARVEVRQGMQDFEASLEVETKSGVTRYRLLEGRVDNHASWSVLLGKLSVTSSRVMIRSLSGGVYVRDTGKRRMSFHTGDAFAARRFVIDIGAKGVQRLTQEWQFTGEGGKPVRGSKLIAKDATQKASERHWLAQFKRRSKKRK